MHVPIPSRATTLILGLALLVSAASTLAAPDAALLEGLSARAIGPAAVSGRITSIDVVLSDPNRIVIGAASGGVWSSDNGGLTWRPLFDEQPVASIGAVAISQSNPDLIWVGTGEGNVRNSTSIGGGIFRSLDGGRSWRRVGLEHTERINRIALHPHDPDIVYVAALGTLWGENAERGIYKTTDGGETWEKILYVDQRTGGSDVKIDPFNSEKLYASMWQHRRWPYFFKSGGPGSGMYISWDGGETWKRRTEEDGLPGGDLGRISFAPSPAERGRVYALVEAEKSALVRSDDGGATWVKTNEEYNIADRPFYYTEIAADPENADRVYNVFTRLSVSIDGGKTFERNPVIDCCEPGNTIHIDNHALWINPEDARHLVIGNDGGIAISRDRGQTWRYVRNLPLSQFYHIRVDDDLPYHIYGGLQDNGSWRGPSEVWESGGIRNLHWLEVGFGDGFDTLPDPQNSRRGYVMSQGGYLYRWNLDTGEQRLIRPAPHGPGVDLRFNWSAALAQDPFDPATIYYGSQFVHRSADRGATWEPISGDLTSNNPDWQIFRESGGLTPDVTAAENFTTITAIAPSPIEPKLLWVGTDDGRVHVSRDGGGTWRRIDQGARGVPAGSWVPMIAPSAHEPGTAFIVFDNHRRSDMQPYVFRIEEYGRRWENLVDRQISGYALSILQDHVDPGLLFLGTEFGLYLSTDGGSSWLKFTAGVPTVSVMDMAIQQRENDLVLGTHGRSLYVLDDYSALRNLEADDFDARLKILSLTPGQQYVSGQRRSTRFTGSGEFRGQNEPYGVLITFMASGEELPHPDADTERERSIRRRTQDSPTGESQEDKQAGDQIPKVTLTVRDAGGEAIRLIRRPVHLGVNRVVWAMARDGARPMPGPEAEDIEDGLPAGPEVPPGRYEIELAIGAPEANHKSVTAEAVVLADPRSATDGDARERNYAVRLDLLEMEQSAVTQVERIVAARRDVDTVVDLLEEREKRTGGDAFEALREQARSIRGELDELEKRFRVPPQTKGIVYDDDRVVNRINLAQSYVGSSHSAPTPTAMVYVERAGQALAEASAAVETFMGGKLAGFSQAVEAAGIGLFRNALEN